MLKSDAVDFFFEPFMVTQGHDKVALASLTGAKEWHQRKKGGCEWDARVRRRQRWLDDDGGG